MEEKNSLLKWAMTYGLFMGLYWAFKYIFFILSCVYMQFSLVFLFLSMAVPFIAYYFTKKYRDQGLGGSISFYHAWRFGIMLYFFAALIVAVVHFIIYRFILSPEEFFSKLYEQAILRLQEMHLDSGTVESMQKLPVLTATQMVVQSVFNNIFWGIVFSVPVAWIVSRTGKTLPGYAR